MTFRALAGKRVIKLHERADQLERDADDLESELGDVITTCLLRSAARSIRTRAELWRVIARS